MSPIILIVLGILCAGGAAAFVGMAIYGKSRHSRAARLLSAKTQMSHQGTRSVTLRPAKQQELKQLMTERVLKPLSGLMKFSTGPESRVVERLVYAGMRKKGAAEIFLGAKMALSLALPAAAAGFVLWRARVSGSPLEPNKLIMYCAGALAAGMMLPNVWLQRKARIRQEKIRFALPDALDLLVICIESGLALDAAFIRIGREMRETAPELCEELTLMNLEVSAGKPRDECMRNFGLRTGVEEVKALTARLIQAIKFGTNLAVSLRVHAESLRIKRRQEAEERAAKTTVKLLFPLVFFVFPALLVVILGPALTSLKDFMQ